MGSDARRRLPGNQGLEARNQQAARDALRRRQKAKKAKTVKRHVRYKDKKKLLGEFENAKKEVPIVASELPHLLEEEEEALNYPTDPGRKQQAKKDDTTSKGVVAPSEAQQKPSHRESAPQRGTLEDNKPRALEKDGISTEATVSAQATAKKKYLPFTKERKEFKKAQAEREAREKERQGRIKVREKMLQKSKKERRERVSFSHLRGASALGAVSSNLRSYAKKNRVL